MHLIKTPAASRASLDAVFRDREYDVHPFPGWTPEVIVDAGAHVGAFAIWASLRWPQSRIFCFEPSETTFRLLAQNVGHQGNISLRQIALLDHEGEQWLYHGRNNPGERSLSRGAQQVDAGETVRVERLSSELRRHQIDAIGILKIDTEGAEVPILRDLHDFLPRIDFVVLEYHRDDDRRVIEQMFAKDFLLFGGRVIGFHRGVLKYVSRRLIGDAGEAGAYLKAEESK